MGPVYQIFQLHKDILKHSNVHKSIIKLCRKMKSICGFLVLLIVGTIGITTSNADVTYKSLPEMRCLGISHRTYPTLADAKEICNQMSSCSGVYEKGTGWGHCVVGNNLGNFNLCEVVYIDTTPNLWDCV